MTVGGFWISTTSKYQVWCQASQQRLTGVFPGNRVGKPANTSPLFNSEPKSQIFSYPVVSTAGYFFLILDFGKNMWCKICLQKYLLENTEREDFEIFGFWISAKICGVKIVFKNIYWEILNGKILRFWILRFHL